MNALPGAQPALSPLGIIAGGGELPGLLIDGCRRQGRACFVLGLEGEAEAATVESAPYFWGRMEKLGLALDALRKAGVEELVLVGRVGREAFRPRLPDGKALKLLARLAAVARQGDDALFSAVIAYLEEEGFRVRGVQHVMHSILAQEGDIAGKEPDKSAREDIAVAIEVLKRLGDLDVGQAIIVQRGRVIGIEGAEGTDALITRCRPFIQAGEGGVLVKIKKQVQDERVDLPAIGRGTVENVAAVGLSGIAVEAGKALLIHREALVERAKALGIFITGIRV